MKTVPVKTVYLEMRYPSVTLEPVPPVPNCLIMQAKRPTVSFYKFLYGTVGKKLLWVNRLMMPEEELKKVLENSIASEIYVFYVEGVPAGYAELDRAKSGEGEIELAYFGLMPEFIGKGLGKYLLNWIIKKAWEYNPERLWLHTCELDHPAALPNYLKAGFKIYHTEIIQQQVPE